MARISNLLIDPADIRWPDKVELDLGEGSRDANGNPTILHQAHVIAAYEFIGTPWFCGYVGDSMGNQIRLRMAHGTSR